MQDLSEFASGEEYDAQYGDSYEDEIVALTCLANDTGLSWGSHSIGSQEDISSLLIYYLYLSTGDEETPDPPSYGNWAEIQSAHRPVASD